MDTTSKIPIDILLYKRSTVFIRVRLNRISLVEYMKDLSRLAKTQLITVTKPLHERYSPCASAGQS